MDQVHPLSVLALAPSLENSGFLRYSPQTEMADADSSRYEGDNGTFLSFQVCVL